MKRLIIASLAISLAVVSNAASAFTWKTQGAIYNGTSADFTSVSTVYLINAATLSQEALYKATIDALGKSKTFADAIGKDYVATATLSSGKITAQDLSTDATGSTTFYMALFDSTMGDDGAIYFSDAITKALSATGTQNYAYRDTSSKLAAASSMDGFSASSGGWVAVPEPTSAMLLMLGLCGLALKRKNA